MQQHKSGGLPIDWYEMDARLHLDNIQMHKPRSLDHFLNKTVPSVLPKPSQDILPKIKAIVSRTMSQRRQLKEDVSSRTARGIIIRAVMEELKRIGEDVTNEEKVYHKIMFQINADLKSC